ncbi:vanadium-dependent haloperoxidase [Streptomyces enissocaesilis]|uniref:Vanadium-dependent haloperoxidase n=1 Tax=Streptomyces enissocaesilis TaxID=332589 RepID=A0ABP6JBA1_9ACTN
MVGAHLGPSHPSGQGAVWHSFVSAAVYNAVVGIQGRYAPYKWRVKGPSTASPEAAAVAAAHRVLLDCFPASRTRLDAAYADSLAKIPDGRAERQGVAFGERAADHILKLREGDGRHAPVEFNAAPAPGVWRPTPPDQQPYLDAWLGRLRPMTLTSPDQFRPGPPPALSSPRYARDLNELKAMGGKTGSGRTARQTETALFFGGNLLVQFQTGIRDYADRHRLGIADTARLFAAANVSATDAVVASWDAKLHYGFWRPVTAIRMAGTDGNPATAADPKWQPLAPNTPPHPDYISGHATVASAVLRAVTGILGTARLDLHVRSEATGTARHYKHADQFNKDMIDARVWVGVHTRTADVVGCRTGNRIGTWVLSRHFQPLGRAAASPVSQVSQTSQRSQSSQPAPPKCPS